MAYYELKCGASFDREQVAEMWKHVTTCAECIIHRAEFEQSLIDKGIAKIDPQTGDLVWAKGAK